jgi:hypothetical protein
MTTKLAGRLAGILLALLCLSPARGAVTGDVILSLRYWESSYGDSTRLGNVRLLGDADVAPTVRAHLDYDHESGVDEELYEAYGEWRTGKSWLRLGRFELPFGIYNRSELYYVGLIYAPILKYYLSGEYQLGRSEHGLTFTHASGPWQIETALFSKHGGLQAILPSGGEGSLRIQRFLGPVILGLNGEWEDGIDPQSGAHGKAHFLGLDFRASRPSLIVRGEVVSGHVPGGSPWGYYLDLLYRPVALQHGTIVGRVETASGRGDDEPTYRRQTVGFKWDFGHGLAGAVNQVFETPRSRYDRQGTSVYIWYTHRL